MRSSDVCLALLLIGCSSTPTPDTSESGGTSENAGASGGSQSGTGGNTGEVSMGGAGGTAGKGGTSGAAGASGSGGSIAAGGHAGADAGAGGQQTQAKGDPGVWTNVTPSQLTLNWMQFSNDNFGLQDVLVDPVRPSDFYAFVCHQGVWKSTDYGLTWTKVNTGTNGAVIDTGKPWGSGIDSNKSRDPKTPPTLYTLNGNGQQGFWKSTDGGVSWARTGLPDQARLQYDQDAYSIGVDPYDGTHILMGFHEAVGIVESTDGGATFVARNPGDSGASAYPYFIDTGVPATTRTTWLTLGQTGSMSRTTDSGATWKTVDSLQHAHGCSQIFQAGGVVYAAGSGGSAGDGVYRSKDYGVTWTNISPGKATVLVGTGDKIFCPMPGRTRAGTTRTCAPRREIRDLLVAPRDPDSDDPRLQGRRGQL